MTTINTISDVTNAGSYTQLIWNAFDADSLDTSFWIERQRLRVDFTFTGSNYYLVDGFEALGNISLSYDIAIAPEPSSGMMFAVVLGTLERAASRVAWFERSRHARGYLSLAARTMERRALSLHGPRI